jgi:integrase/recombinase XerD
MVSFNGAGDWQIHDAAGRRKYLNEQEFRRFLDTADGHALERRALCYLLAYAGCRLSEALALTVHHLDTEHRTVTFRTLKRRRICYRTVPVPDVARDLLRKLPIADDGRLWPVHRATAWRWLKAVMRRAGITGPMATPKGLRHGFGMRAAGKNVPLPIIQKWMGHASPTTTAIYLDAVGIEERQFASRMW